MLKMSLWPGMAFFCLRQRHRRFTGLNEPPSVAAAPQHISYISGDELSADSYESIDVFIGVAAAATGIPEHDFLRYVLRVFGHEQCVFRPENALRAEVSCERIHC